MEDLLFDLISPPADLLLWLLFSREGVEIMPSLLLFTSVASIFLLIYAYRAGK